MDDFRTGSIIRYRPLAGAERLCRVTGRFDKDGYPAFDAVEVDEVGDEFAERKIEKPFSGCWGYEDQITEVVRF